MPIQVSKKNKKTQDYYLQPPWDPSDWEAMVGSDPSMAGTGYSAVTMASLTNADVFQTGAALGLTRPEVQAEMERGIQAGAIPRIGTAPHLPAARKWLMDQYAPGYDPYLSALKARNANLPPGRQELALSPVVWGRQGAMSRQMLTTGISEAQLSTRPDIVTSHLGMGITPEGGISTSTDPAKFLKHAKRGGRHAEIMAEGLPTFRPDFQVGPSQGPGVKRQAVRGAFTFGEMEGGGQGTYDPSRLGYFSQRSAVDIWPAAGQTEVTGLAPIGEVWERGQQVQLAAGKTGLKDAWWNTRVLGYEDVTKTEYRANEAGERIPYQVAGKRAVLEQFQVADQINLQMKYGQKLELRPGSLGGLTGAGGQPLGVDLIAPVKSVENLALQWFERRGRAGMAEALGVPVENLAGKTYNELQPQLMKAFTEKIMPSRMQEVQWPVTFHESQLPYFKGMLTGEPAPVAGQPGFYSGVRRGTAFIDEVAAVFSQSFHSKGRAYFSPEELENVRAMQPQMYKEIMHESYRQRRAYSEVVGAATATAGKEVARGFARVPTTELQKMYIQATGAARERLGLGPAEALPRGAAAPELLSRMAQSPYGRRGMIFGSESNPLYTLSARSLQYFSAQGPDVGMEVSPYLNAVTELVGAAGTPGAEQLAIEGGEGVRGVRQLQEQLATSSEAVRRSRGALAHVGGAVQHLSPLLAESETFVPGLEAGAIVQQTRQPSYGRQTFNPQLAEVNVGEEEFRRRGAEDVYHTYRSPAAVQAGRGDVDGDAIVQRLISTGAVKEQPDGSYVNQGGQTFASRQAMVAEANRAIAAGAGDVAEDMIGYKGTPQTREQVLAQEQGRAAKTYTKEEFAGHLEFGQRMYGEIGPGFNVGTRMESEVTRGDEAARAAVEAVHQRTYERAQRPAELTPGMKHLQDLARGFSFGTGGVRLTGAKGGVGRVDKGTLTGLATGGLRALTMDVIPAEQIAALNAPAGPGRERVRTLAEEYYASAGKTTDKETAFSQLATGALEATGGYEAWATESVMGRTLGGAAASRLQRRAIEKGWTTKQLKSTIAKSGLENVYEKLLTAKEQQDLFVAARRHQTGRTIEDVAEIRRDIRRREGAASGIPMTPDEQFAEDFYTDLGRGIERYEAARGKVGIAEQLAPFAGGTPESRVEAAAKLLSVDPGKLRTRGLTDVTTLSGEEFLAGEPEGRRAHQVRARARLGAGGAYSVELNKERIEVQQGTPMSLQEILAHEVGHGSVDKRALSAARARIQQNIKAGMITPENLAYAKARLSESGTDLETEVVADTFAAAIINKETLMGVQLDPEKYKLDRMMQKEVAGLRQGVPGTGGEAGPGGSQYVEAPYTPITTEKYRGEDPDSGIVMSRPAGGGRQPPGEPPVVEAAPTEPRPRRRRSDAGKPRGPRTSKKTATPGRVVDDFLRETGLYDPSREQQAFYMRREEGVMTIKEMSSKAAIDKAFGQMSLIEYGVAEGLRGRATVDEPHGLAAWQKAGMGKARQVGLVRSLAAAGATGRVTKESLGAATELAGMYQQSYETARKAGAMPELLEPAQETMRFLNQQATTMAAQFKAGPGGLTDNIEKASKALERLTETGTRYDKVMDRATKNLREGQEALGRGDAQAIKKLDPFLALSKKDVAYQLASAKEMMKDLERGGGVETPGYKEARGRVESLRGMQDRMEAQQSAATQAELEGGLKTRRGRGPGVMALMGLSYLPWQLQFSQQWGGQQARAQMEAAAGVDVAAMAAGGGWSQAAVQARELKAKESWSQYYLGQGAAAGFQGFPAAASRLLASQPGLARGVGAVEGYGPLMGYGLVGEMMARQLGDRGLLLGKDAFISPSYISSKIGGPGGEGWGGGARKLIGAGAGIGVGVGMVAGAGYLGAGAAADVLNAQWGTEWGTGEFVTKGAPLAGKNLVRALAAGGGLAVGGIDQLSRTVAGALGVSKERIGEIGYGHAYAQLVGPLGAETATEREIAKAKERQAAQRGRTDVLDLEQLSKETGQKFTAEELAAYSATYKQAGISTEKRAGMINQAFEMETRLGMTPGGLGQSLSDVATALGAVGTQIGTITANLQQKLSTLTEPQQRQAIQGMTVGAQQWGTRPAWAGLTALQGEDLTWATRNMSPYEREKYIREQTGATPLAYSNRVRRAARGDRQPYRRGTQEQDYRQDIADLAVVDEMGRPTNWDEGRALELAQRQWDVRRTQFGFTQEREQLTAQRGWMQRGYAIEDRLRPIRERYQVEDADMALARMQQQLQQATGADLRQRQIQSTLFEKGQTWRASDIETAGARARTQWQWQQSDFAKDRSTFELQQGWQQEDFAEAIRFSTGRQRRKLTEQQERATQMANIQRQGMVEGETRAGVAYKWGEEDRAKDLARLKEEGALRREAMTLEEESNKKSLELLKKQYEQAVERRKELVDIMIPAEREQEKLQREQAEQGLVWKEQRLALDQEYYAEVQPLQEAMNLATDAYNEAWVKYQNMMETDIPTAMELAAKRGDKAWGDMLKNIQDGLAAIAKTAEGVAKTMEDTGKKAASAWPDEARRNYDRLMPNVGV